MCFGGVACCWSCLEDQKAREKQQITLALVGLVALVARGTLVQTLAGLGPWHLGGRRGRVLVHFVLVVEEGIHLEAGSAAAAAAEPAPKLGGLQPPPPAEPMWMKKKKKGEQDVRGSSRWPSCSKTSAPASGRTPCLSGGSAPLASRPSQ